MKFTLTPTNHQALFDKLSARDKSKIYVVEMYERKSIRSTEQNSRLWGVLYKAISEATGYEIDEVHQLMGYKFLRYQKNDQEFIKSTTKLDTKEMTDYQDSIARWASSQGIWID